MHTHIENTPPGPRAQADRSAIVGWGADLDHALRPPYPMERTPPRLPNVHWDQPSVQPVNVEVLVSTERPGITPVFGTTLPPRGLSGSLRRLAFKASENDVRRWLLLMLADRIDVVEGLLQDLAQGHLPNVLGDSAAALEDTDHFSLVIGNGEFIQSTGCPAENDDDIRRAHVNDVASFEAKAGIDDHICRIGRHLIALDVLPAIFGGRNADSKPAVFARGSRDQIRQTRGSSGDQNTIVLGDGAAEFFCELLQAGFFGIRERVAF